VAAEKTKQKEVVGRQEAAKKQSRKKWWDGRQLRNKVERSGHIVATEKTMQKEVDILWQLEKTKQKEVDRWEAPKKQSRKKWTDGRQLRNKLERSGHIVATENIMQKEVDW
jgi:hypothetical protein